MKIAIRSYTKLIIIVSFIISFCLILFIAYRSNDYINQLSENNKKLYASYKISETMKIFRNNIDSLGIYQRGYNLTGDRSFMEHYIQKETETKSELDSLGEYLKGNQEESLYLKLKDLTFKKLMEGKDFSHKINLPGVNQVGNGSKEGKEIVEEINKALVEIINSLSAASVVLISKSNDLLEASQKWSYGEIIIGILASLAAILILFRDINVRNRLEVELRAAKKQADENAMLKEQFMANMSHEIRTPMNAIIGFSSLLQKTQLDESQSEYLSAIKNSGSNLLNIINDILDFSKIEAGMLHLEKIPFSITKLINSLKLMFSEKAKEKNIDFEITIDKSIPENVFGDPTRLTQILVNLINNAIKFTNKGKVKVTCELKNIENNQAKLVFRIKDTGIGIPADKINDVFERFNQGNSETTRKYGGTGLGLSIVKNLVEIQHGEISLTSKEGEGSEFTVIISYPINNESLVSLKENEEIKIFGTKENKYKVLLAEDNIMNQKLASTLLKGFGLEVDIAENGLIAMEKVKNNTYQLVLMDIQMPTMDGYVASRKIRDEIKSIVPIIAMTAHIMPGEKEKCMSFGMNDYISKPFKEIELYNIISKYLNEEIQLKKTPIELTEEKENYSTIKINLDELRELAKGDKIFMKEMIELFLEQNPLDIKEIGNAIKENDFDTIQAISHRMKTSVGFMGLRPLLKPLSTMETTAETKQGMETIVNAFNEVKTVSENAVTELKKTLTEIKS